MTIVATSNARRLTYQLENVPTHHEIESLYETAKKNQWNGSQAIDWSRPEVSERYVKKLHRIYLVDPLLRALIDEILSTDMWEL